VLADTAREAFVSGMHTAAFVAAGVALCGALVALLFLPARASEADQRLQARELGGVAA
jgi:hypothetical protein